MTAPVVPSFLARRRAAAPLLGVALVAVALSGCVTRSGQAGQGQVCNRAGVLAATCPPGSIRPGEVPPQTAAQQDRFAPPPAATVPPPQRVETAVLPMPDGSPSPPPPAPVVVTPAPPVRTAGRPIVAVTAPLPAPQRLPAPAGPRRTLPEVVALALSQHPELGMQRSRAQEAADGVRVARAGLLPQAEVRFSIGQGTPIQPEGSSDAAEPGGSMANQRTGALSMRQLLFDFGATRNEIMRNRNLAEAERYRLLDRIDDVALRSVQAYLRVIEQRQLIALADENVAAHRRLSELVRANQREGNSTVADTSRIAARLVEAQTIRTNLDTDLQQALDQLRRLTRLEPAPLAPPPTIAARLPADADAAIAEMRRVSPRLQALMLGSDAIRREIAAQRAGNMPRVGFELEGSVRDYGSPVGRTETDLRGMITVRQRLFDGGMRAAQIDQAASRLNENQYRLRNETDELEANVRQAFRAIVSARQKLATLNDGVSNSRRVQLLYTEQFQAGRRTLFELLDAHQSLYTARREQIVNQFEELRASYALLRNVGRLAETILVARAP